MKLLGYLVIGFGLAFGLSLTVASATVFLHGAPYASIMRPVTTWGLPIAVIFAAAFVMAQPSARAVVALHAVAITAIAGAVLWPVYALAQDASGTAINAGGLFSDVRGTIEMVVGVVVAAIVGWLSLLVKSNLGISIDTKMRDTLQSAIMNGVHYGLDGVQSLADNKTIDVKYEIVAKGIEYVRQYAPKAIKHFGLGDDDLEAMLKAQLAKLQPAEVTAVAKATGA